MVNKSSMKNEDFSGLAFSGKKKDFTQWREDIYSKLKKASLGLEYDAISKGYPTPLYEYGDLLVKEPVVPKVGENATAEEQKTVRMQGIQIRQMEWYLRDMLNATLPADYRAQLPRPVNEERLPVLWRGSETYYGESGTRGMVNLLQEFEGAMGSDFESVDHLLTKVNSVRNRVNQLSAKTLGLNLIPSQTMLLRVLFLLPSEYWGPSVVFTGQDFTVEKVTEKLRAVFGNKTKAQILTMDRVAANHIQVGKGKGKKTAVNFVKSQQFSGQKRKAESEPAPGECYYCGGKYNKDGKPHRKADCPKRKADLAAGVARRDIWSEPKLLSEHKRPRANVAVKSARQEIFVDSATIWGKPAQQTAVSWRDGRPDVPSPEPSSDSEAESDDDSHSQHSDFGEFHRDTELTREIPAAVVRVTNKKPRIARMLKPFVPAQPMADIVDLSGDTVMEESAPPNPPREPITGDRGVGPDGDTTMEEPGSPSESAESQADDKTTEAPIPPKVIVSAAVARAVGKTTEEPVPANEDSAPVDTVADQVAQVAETLNDLCKKVEEKAAVTD